MNEIMYVLIITLVVTLSFLLFDSLFKYFDNVATKEKINSYENSEFFIQTRIDYYEVIKDRGLIGEYEIYSDLSNLKGYKRFLFSAYIPKGDGNAAEIDIILLHSSGIYVIESKNFNGVIYGGKYKEYWTQVNTKWNTKKDFYNPTFQNISHIKYLGKYLKSKKPDITKDLFVSYIVFGDDCDISNISLTNSAHIIINRKDVLKEIEADYDYAGNIISDEDIDHIYKILYPLTQVNEQYKVKHANKIKNKYKHH